MGMDRIRIQREKKSSPEISTNPEIITLRKTQKALLPDTFMAKLDKH